MQIDIYQHFEDPLEAKQLFIRMGQGDYREWDALTEWMDADYPGTWRDWWEKHSCCAPLRSRAALPRRLAHDRSRPSNRRWIPLGRISTPTPANPSEPK